MKRGVWIPVLCVVVASAAFSLTRAEQPLPTKKRRIGLYSQRYAGLPGGKPRAHADEETPDDKKAEPKTFKLRPVKPISEIGATDVPPQKIPRSPAIRQVSGDARSGSLKPFPGVDAGGAKPVSVKPAEFQEPLGVRPTKSIQQIKGTSPTPFPTAAKVKAKAGANPFAIMPPNPETTKPVAKPVSQPKAGPVAEPVKTASVASTRRASTRKLPTIRQLPNSPRTPMVTVRWVKQSDINVGKKCRFDLIVKNTGANEARFVSVEVAFPSTVRLVSSNPKPAAAKTRAIWRFDSLPAGESKTIELTALPATAGDIDLQAAVRFTGVAPGLFTVNEPKLHIAFIGPEKVLVGDPAPQVIEISNPGTGIAKSVAIEASIPAGLQHPRGKKLAMEIGSLNPGETRKVRLTLKAIASGKQVIKINATSEAALPKTKLQTVAVSAPSLKVTLDGPGLRYVGRNALYSITVKNDGSIATNNVRVLHRLPEGTRFLKADKGGSYSYSKRTIGWFVGRLEPGNSVTVKAIIACTEIGKKVHLAGAVSEQGTKAQTKRTTNVDGIASLVVGILNPDDPVEVGAATTYEIRVRNKGTKADENIVLTCHLPAGMQLLAAQGVTRSAAGKGKVVFAPLKSLPPGKTAIYRVKIRGAVAGNLRFRASIRSGSMKESLSYAKLTRFYAD